MKAWNLRDVSIRWKVMTVLFVVVAFTLLLVGTGLLLHTRASFEREMTQRLTLIADVVGQNSTGALAFRDPRAAIETLAALRNDERVMAGSLYDEKGRLFATYVRPGVTLALPETAAAAADAPSFESGRVTLARPVELKGQTIGEVFLVADTEQWVETLQAFLAILVTLCGVVLAVGFLVSMGLQRWISRPVEELAKLMRRFVHERDFGLRAVKHGNDEIGVLTAGFNEMLEEIGRRGADVERTQQELRARVAELDAEVKERRRAEAELRGNREQLQHFIENANVGMHWVGPDGVILWANRYELNLLGYDAAEYIGHHVREFHADADNEDIVAQLGRAEALENYEVRLICKDRSIRHVLMNTSAYCQDGKFVHTRCFMRDITERKHAEDALRRGEERYRTLVAATSSVVLGTDGSGRVVQRLPSWEEYTGQAWEQYAGAGWWDMIHAEDRARVQGAWARAVSTGTMFEAEARVWHQQSRRYRYCLGRAVPLGEPAGAVHEWVGTMLDIDDRKRAEEQFRIAVEGAPNAMLMIDQHGRIVLINRQLEVLFGYAREELLGQPVERLVPERLRHAHPKYRGEFFGDPNARPMGAGRDLYGRHKDGREVPVEIGLNPFTTEEGSFCLASIIDISERRRADHELRRYTEELQRSNRELGQFAYVASHDLQEPLRAISGCVQLLAQRYQDKLDSRANELIDHTVGGAARMQALINDLLSYSRVSTRARPFETCDLGQPLAQALANLEFAVRESGAVITVDPMPLATVDPTQLTQLFQNLIGNGIKFRADRPPKIHVGARPRQGGHIFHVTDNGIGIEAQYIDRIFGVFQRLHSRNKYPGNGIGLAICRKIIERHNGRIWVESIPGKGSTFYFTLPAGSVHNVEQSERYSSQQN